MTVAPAIGGYYGVDIPVLGLLAVAGFGICLLLHGLFHSQAARKFNRLFWPSAAFLVGAWVALAVVMAFPGSLTKNQDPKKTVKVGQLEENIDLAETDRAQANAEIGLTYSEHDRDNIYMMMSEINQVSNVEMMSAVNLVRDACRPWIDSEKVRDGILAEQTIKKLQLAESQFNASHEKIYKTLRDRYSIYWNVAEKALGQQKYEEHPATIFRIAVFRLQIQLSYLSKIDRKIASTPNGDLLAMLSPDVERVFLSADSLENWVAQIKALTKQEGDRLRAKK